MRPIVAIVALGLLAAVTVSARAEHRTELVVATDNHAPELWKELNARFEAAQAARGKSVAVKPSVASWTKQRDAVVKKDVEPDVVALGVGTDLDPVRRAGVIPDNWAYLQPHRSTPYATLTVFVVPAGNPKAVKDWPDLARDGVRVLSLNPKGSRTARHGVLAAYGAVTQRGGTAAEAEAFLAGVFAKAKLPAPRPAGAAGAAPAAPPASDDPGFAPAEPGDVLLTWEKEALDLVKKSEGKLAVVYPPVSVRGESQVVIAAGVGARGTAAAAESYVKFLYSDEGQQLFAKHGYRPVRPAALRAARPDAPEVELFDARDLFPDVAKGHEQFFGPDGHFEGIRAKASAK